MKQENNFDDIDQMFFSYFKNHQEIPESTEDVINNLFINNPYTYKRNLMTLRKAISIIVALAMLSIGIVFASDIINFIKSLFTNSTEGIQTAIENDYVQNVDMDFIYDNNLGVKVDYLVMDETNLNVSFVYDYQKDDDFTDISLGEYIIIDENNNIIGANILDYDPTKYSNIIVGGNSHNSISNSKLRESILITSSDMPTCDNLTFEIHSINIEKDDKISVITGNWMFNIELADMIVNPNSEKYICSYNKYIKNISTQLNDTSLQIDIELTDAINKNILHEFDSIKLKNSSNEIFDLILMDFREDNSNNDINIQFDISKYSENIDNLNLYVKFDVDKEFNITLKK